MALVAIKAPFGRLDAPLPRPVLFQLDGPNRADPVERVTLIAQAAVPVAEVAVDPATAHEVIRVVGVTQREALEDTELRLNEIEPGGLGGSPDRGDLELTQQGPKVRVIVGLFGGCP
ncbi:MAG TPA: hypothetical protein VIG29_03885 [Vicinamibacteria bacterium]|jgi:hypothetical protein